MSHLVTPHEQVLRARLERVLSTSAPQDARRGRSPSHSISERVQPITVYKDLTSMSVQSSPKYFGGPSRTPNHPPLSSVSESFMSQKKLSSSSGSAGSTPPLVRDDDEASNGRRTRQSLLTPPCTPSPPNHAYFQDPDWSYKTRYYPSNQQGDEEDEEEDDNQSCSSYSSYRLDSSFSSSLHHRRPPSPPATPPQKSYPTTPHSPRRQFNARHASLQCRAIEGYVSFADIEGLGTPPDDLSSPTSTPDRKGSVFNALSWGLGGGVVRKIMRTGGEPVEV